ncbi:helix-turn-helix domain-containing protein [Apilactobacillus xinyiensis]|uniref:helix-turn-helix domain-containing protein n=1 Tax=Apilactobacillus xinyiensis TaxID=2841032 RepID=UPI00200C87FC|nr:helix-turn-helix transcriptional regulator [Apilactobacillus xinyiensis]MCL0330562.1 helix-turn-helix transcriptional regulator [Apilactobacillus xinyiensis]
MPINLQQRRLELDMTLEEVGKLVGVGKSTVRKWESGYIANMGRDKIVKYSNALQINPMELVDPQHTLENNNVVDRTAKIMNKLTPNKQERVYGFALSQLNEKD